MRLRALVPVGAIVCGSACGDPTKVDVGAAVVTWIEWPAGVTPSQPGALRISGYAQCPYRAVFSVAVDQARVVIAAEGRSRGSPICAQDGSGAGYDTLLPLPKISLPDGFPIVLYVVVPMSDGRNFYAPETAPRNVGSMYVARTPDTTTRLAGRVVLRADTSGCWRAMPFSASPRPEFAFTKPVPLTPGTLARAGFVSGSLVTASPPICGQVLAINATELTVDATPR